MSSFEREPGDRMVDERACWGPLGSRWSTWAVALTVAGLAVLPLASCADDDGTSASTGGAAGSSTGGLGGSGASSSGGGGGGGGGTVHEQDCDDDVDNDGDGDEDCEDADCTGDPACATPGDPLFFDDFEYVASRDDADVVSVFQNEGGWEWAKTVQAGETGAKGYVHTVDSIPGYSGPFPGLGSQTVLCMEALPTSLGDHDSDFWGDWQTDFYLQYGDTQGPADAIPADVWFQFWVYPTGGYDHGMKFLYPCNGDYPCQDLNWLLSVGTTSATPLHHQVLPDGTINELQLDPPPNQLPAPHVFLQARGTGAEYQPANPHAYHGPTLGQSDVAELMQANRWTLVKIHFDTSGAQGTYEAWMRPRGGSWTKVVEWIDNSTPDFTWPLAAPGGHRVLRMPTTVGSQRVLEGYPDWSYDSLTYMDDFAMAVAEADLPAYQ